MRRPSRRVLLFTNAEHGQANVSVATSYGLVQLGADVHFASFPAIQDTVKSLFGSTVTFHRVNGVDMKSAYPRNEVLQSGLEGRTPGFLDMPALLRICLHTTMPWSGPEYVDIYRSVVEIMQSVKPDIIAIDPAFAPAITACRHMEERFLVLAPNTIKDFAMPFQPAGEVFWKYPCVASGLGFPLPWHHIILNIYYVLLAITICRCDKRHKEVNDYVKAHTGGEMVTLDDLNQRPPPGVKYLVANIPEIEFPLAKIPPHIIPCGPMVRPSPTVAEVDRDLADWIAGGPTVYINLGTHAKTTEQTAVEIAKSINHLLETTAQDIDLPDEKSPLSRLRVLWKLTRKPPIYDDTSLATILAPHLQSDRVRIIPWLEPEPSSLLSEPNLICAVHHGGANSFLEAVAAGVPQVVLPVWIDCFDYANRAELLGIGLWGNKAARPRCVAAELAPALVRVVSGVSAMKMRRKVRELARLCARDPGRMVAARSILGEI